MITALCIGANAMGFIILCFMYYYISKLRKKQREHELTQSRMTAMLSQIQSHFIYNSLTAISDMCNGNSEVQEALAAFSDYLRVNIGSLNQKALVPFETELNHVKHYLFLEKLRFEERLQTIYEINETNFKVPVLSIQPIVENAVSHGLFNKQGVGTVRIRTKETETDYIVTVVDDGIGYDTNAVQETEKTHSGIENAKNRLFSMCGGTLTIYSKPGIGTRVHIIIPKEPVST